MAKDWSPTRQAEQNLQTGHEQEAKRKIAVLFETDIANISNALDNINELNVDENDTDMLAAIRALGALKARIERKLHKHTEIKVPF